MICRRALLLTKIIQWLTVLVVAWVELPARGETKLDFWHSYIHQPSGVIHYSFQIARYKRGLFFGSCGPSTRSLQWEYDIDLAGKGPVYQREAVTMTSEGKKVELRSGTITVGPKSGEATINLRIKSAGTELEFAGNGTHQIRKSR
jgi:hypothetical protein